MRLDLGDAILDAHPDLDIERVLTSVRVFAESVETPEILSDLETLLARRRKRMP